MPTTIPADKQTVAVVGGGLVGALTAIMLHRRGFTVHLFEGRLDWREDARRAVDKVKIKSFCAHAKFIACLILICDLCIVIYFNRMTCFLSLNDNYSSAF